MDNNANPNIHTIVKAQIVFLLSTLTEENFERNQVEIRSVRSVFYLCRVPRTKRADAAGNYASFWGVHSYPNSMDSTPIYTSYDDSSYTRTADSHRRALRLPSTPPQR